MNKPEKYVCAVKDCEMGPCTVITPNIGVFNCRWDEEDFKKVKK